MRAPIDSLTQREREVLALIRRGLTNEEIAHRLDISLDGAKYHVSQILSKLGVATREEAAGVVLGERRRWYWKLVWIGGAGVTAAALAGLGALAWGAAQMSQRSSDDCATGDEAAVGGVDEEILADLRDAPFSGGIIGFLYGDTAGESTDITPGELPPLTMDEVRELIDTGEMATIEIGDTISPRPDRHFYAYRDPSGEIQTWPIVGEYVRVVTRDTLESQAGSDTVWFYPHPVLCETGTSIGLSSESVEVLLDGVREYNSEEQRTKIEVWDERGRPPDWLPSPSPTP